MTKTTVPPLSLSVLDLSLLDSVTLQRGNGKAGGTELCVENLACAMRGLPHSDHPACVDEGIIAFSIRLNDANWVTGEMRQGLKPFALRQLGTADDGFQQQRAFLAADYAVRKFAPIALRARGFVDLAGRLESLPEIVDSATAETARKEAYDAHGAAADAAAATELWHLSTELLTKMVSLGEDAPVRAEIKAYAIQKFGV
jgi:hypothetical protein